MTTQQETPHYTTHPKVVAGVVLIASLTLFSLLFWATLLIAAVVAPVETRYIGSIAIEPALEDYYSARRLLLSAAVGCAGTGAFWWLVPDR
jgi:hypothetical protein